MAPLGVAALFLGAAGFSITYLLVRGWRTGFRLRPGAWAQPRWLMAFAGLVAAAGAMVVWMGVAYAAPRA